MDITLLFFLSLLFMSFCLLFIYSSLGFCCCVFVSFLVMSGKLKCHPSPIHRPDRDRKLSQPPSILLPSPIHPPISTHVSVVMGNSDKRTLMGKNMLSLGLQGKAASFHSIISPCYALPNTLFMDKLCTSNDSSQIAFLYALHISDIKSIKTLADLCHLRTYPDYF